jgi:hypothetical protein
VVRVSIFLTQTGVGAESRTYGLYDADCVIAIVAGNPLDPMVVVDHEITHITLSKTTSLGLLHQVLTATRWLSRMSAHGSEFEDLDAAVAPLLSSLHAVEDETHEAVAWLGTELTTRGQENLVAPTRYKSRVDRLWRLIESAPGAPLREGAQAIEPVMTVAEAVALAALSPPAAGRIMAERSFRLIRGGELTRPAEQPVARLDALCDRLAGTPFEALDRWSHSVFEAYRTGDATTLPPVPGRPDAALPAVALRKTLYRDLEGVYALMRSVMSGSFAPEVSDDALAAHWDWFVNQFVFDVKVDRYAQVHVIPPVPRPDFKPPVVKTAYPPPELLTGFAVGVTRAARTAEDDLRWAKPQSAAGVGVFSIHDDRRRNVMWETDVRSGREFLAMYSREAPVVVAAVGYDADRGDFDGAPVLAGVPHVALAVKDFRSFWSGHAHRGLFGSSTIEWMPMPSPSDPQAPIGFLVLKGAGSPSPIYVMPCVVTKFRRIVSIAERQPSPNGVRLVEGTGSPFRWLGGMGGAVVAAARAWEAQYRSFDD